MTAGTPVLAAPAEPPRLAVVISVDQFRYDYLSRFRPYFTEGGFERLLKGGTNFEHCTYRYASTKTAVGHATIAAGSNPEVHGIVANEWVDRETLLSGLAVEDAGAPLVGLAPTTMRLPGGGLDPRSGRSPRRLLAATIGDQLKATHGPEAKVFGISNKDRSAILMAGARADGAYWDESGRMVTSRYYRDELPAWAEAFNARQIVESYFGKTWERLLAPEIYDAVQGPDDAEGELVGNGLDRSFPHVFDGGLSRPGGDFYSAFDNAPFTTEFLATFARELIDQENLGRDEIPDLLCLGFSQVDSLGHNYGTDSHEMMDTILRLDRTLAEFFEFLDERIGAGRYVIVLTADHGAPSMPETLARTQPNLPAGRVNTRQLDVRMAAALDATFGPLPTDEVWFVRDNQGYHFRPSALAAKQLDVVTASRALRDALRTEPEIETAHTRGEVMDAPTTGDSLLTLMRRSIHAERSQDVLYVVKPYFIEKSRFGTNHGSPWDYDRHVPQLWYGAGIASGSRAEPVGVEDIAPTLAALLGIPPPPQATGRRLF